MRVYFDCVTLTGTQTLRNKTITWRYEVESCVLPESGRFHVLLSFFSLDMKYAYKKVIKSVFSPVAEPDQKKKINL